MRALQPLLALGRLLGHLARPVLALARGPGRLLGHLARPVLALARGGPGRLLSRLARAPLLRTAAGACGTAVGAVLELGAWVPRGPWSALCVGLAVAGNLQEYGKVVRLTWQLVTPGDRGDAGCHLCDTMVGLVLKFDENSPSDIDCAALCPFKMKVCVATCSKVVSALGESSRFPCEAAGFCPALDEFGDPELYSCEWNWRRRQCAVPDFPQLTNVCKLKLALPHPHCELKPSLRQWKKYSKVIAQKAGVLANAVRMSPRCGEPGAAEYCIEEASGLGLAAEWGARLLVAFVATFESIRAIETLGGDDDRQWLTFWIVWLGFELLERVSDVVLSRQLYLYYELKFCCVAWLILFAGAEAVYHRVHRTLRRCRQRLRAVALRVRLCSDATAMSVLGIEPPMSDAELVADLRARAGLGALARVADSCERLGSAAVLFADLTSPAAVLERFDGPTYAALKEYWRTLEVRFVELTIQDASGLPNMDGAWGTCDPFVVATLVAPSAADLAADPDLVKDLDAHHAAASDASWLSLFTSARRRHALRHHAAAKAGVGGRGVFREKGWITASGPTGPEGQYARVRTKTRHRTTAPQWMFSAEMYVMGGHVGDSGDYANHLAPYTKLRLEVWDSDRLEPSDFIGEATLPLCCLMDLKEHSVALELSDPEKKNPIRHDNLGKVSFSVQYAS